MIGNWKLAPALVDAVRTAFALPEKVIEVDAHINDWALADAVLGVIDR